MGKELFERTIKNDLCQSLEDIYKCGVYKITHDKNPALIYIGSASVAGKKRTSDNGFIKRFSKHWYDLKNNKHHSKRLQNIVSKYGLNGLYFEILKVCDSSECLFYEQQFIDEFKPKLNTFKFASNSLGYKHSKETILAYRLSRKGRKLSQETKRKISESHKGITPKNFESLRSPEINLKRADRLRGRKPSQKLIDVVSRNINQFDLSGLFIKSYSSMADASRENNIDRGSINNAALGRRLSAGGFLWSYNESVKAISSQKTIIQKSMDGIHINTFNTLVDATKHLGVNSTTAIRNCFCGKQKQAYGYLWQEVRHT